MGAGRGAGVGRHADRNGQDRSRAGRDGPARVATLVVAPVRDLMHQWHRRIHRSLGYDAGIVGDSVFNLQPVTVTTYDSAYARMPEMGDRFGLVIFDEAHHLPGRSYREAALLWQRRRCGWD